MFSYLLCMQIYSTVYSFQNENCFKVCSNFKARPTLPFTFNLPVINAVVVFKFLCNNFLNFLNLNINVQSTPYTASKFSIYSGCSSAFVFIACHISSLVMFSISMTIPPQNEWLFIYYNTNRCKKEE